MKILLAVCGSVSSYKAFDIMREFIREQHHVKIILSAGALHFLKPNLFKYLGALEVNGPRSDLEDSADGFKHITLARWCDRLIIAPLSANMCATLAHGQASCLLSSLFLAMDKSKPIVLCPSMNEKMYLHPHMIKNLETLNILKNLTIIEPDTDILACKEYGIGKLPEVDKIVNISPYLNSIDHPHQKKILITTGATISRLDSIRYLTNESSGLTGFYLARFYLEEGHRVVVIAGMNASSRLDHLKCFKNFTLKRVLSSSDMLQSVENSLLKTVDIYISSAAILDISFKNTKNIKLKKDQLKDHLPIEKTVDILKRIIARKDPTMIIVGFAAETHLTLQALERKMIDKPVDLLIGTEVQGRYLDDSTLKGFQVSSAKYLIIGKKIKPYSKEMSKQDLPLEIMKHLEET